MHRDRHFVSDDGHLAVTITARSMATLVERCRRANDEETGGVLVGRYTDRGDRAVVSLTTGAPKDSRAARWSFFRGIRGLQAVIDRAWRRGEYYLGEWHYHPRASAQPSSTDIQQMVAFAADPEYRCPEPVLVVLGGDPSLDPTITVTVLSAGESLHLHEAR
jgi:integrative and conjugative element protein (TIGR02256 family)